MRVSRRAVDGDVAQHLAPTEYLSYNILKNTSILSEKYY